MMDLSVPSSAGAAPTAMIALLDTVPAVAVNVAVPAESGIRYALPSSVVVSLTMEDGVTLHVTVLSVISFPFVS